LYFSFNYSFLLILVRFCVCMLHEIFTRWLSTLHKLILAHHDEDCECDCSFCLSCGDFDTLSIGKFMRMMLCPPSLRFHGSSTPLFDWDCIEDKYVCVLSEVKIDTNVPIWKRVISVLFRCDFCHSNKLESVFECEVSRLLYDEGEVEYWMYEPVDLTEQIATKAATGSTMQGDKIGQVFQPFTSCSLIGCVLYFMQVFLLIPKETTIGWKGSLLNACSVKKFSTSCRASSYIIKLILLSEMGRKSCCLWSTRFHVYFALILIFRKTIPISIRFFALTFDSCLLHLLQGN
jgi:hypothetical protein